MSRVLPLTPLYPIDLLLDLERLQVVELGLVGLELSVELVLAPPFLYKSEADLSAFYTLGPQAWLLHDAYAYKQNGKQGPRVLD